MEQTELDKKIDNLIIDQFGFFLDERWINTDNQSRAIEAIKQLIQQREETVLREFVEYVWKKEFEGIAYDEHLEDFIQSLNSPKGNEP